MEQQTKNKQNKDETGISTSTNRDSVSHIYIRHTHKHTHRSFDIATHCGVHSLAYILYKRVCCLNC